MHRNYKYSISIALLSLCSVWVMGQKADLLGCGAPIPAARVAFDAGERLTYTVAYKAALINAEVADITLTTSREHYAGKECYKVVGYGETRPFYSLFFTLKDSYTSWLEVGTLRPVRATSHLREGNYHYRSAIDFDYRLLTARSEGHNIKANDTRRFTLRIKPCSYDALSLFYNLRSADLSGLTAGRTRQSLSLVLEDTVRTIQLRFLNREVYFVPGIGKFRTMKFACQFATSTDDSFKDGTEFYLWLSDDDNRIPIYLESPIRVGKVYARLSKWENLKYPFSSFVFTP